MASRNSRTAHPATSQQIESKLRERRIDHAFEPNVRISEIRNVDGYQVRTIEHRAPKDQVARYSTAMKHGAVFPAIVLNDRLEKIDGNTRLEATIRNGGDTIPAYICHGVTTLEARSLSVELNQANGLPMTDDEIKKFVVSAIQEGEQPEIKSLARMTGVKESKIARWIAETKFRARAERAGIATPLVECLPESTKAALEATRLAPVFEKLTTLAAEARMPAADVKKVVARVNSATSQHDAIDIVEAERDARSDQLRSVAAGFKPRPRRSVGSAQHIGALVKFEVDDLLDVAPEKQFETFGRLKVVRDRLDAVVRRAGQEWDLTPPAETTPDAVVTPAAEPSAAESTTAPVPVG